MASVFLKSVENYETDFECNRNVSKTNKNVFHWIDLASASMDALNLTFKHSFPGKQYVESSVATNPPSILNL